MTPDPNPCTFSKFVWGSHALSRVCFFVWLLLQQRINSKSNLHHKSIVQDFMCDLYQEEDGTPNHLIFECRVARDF
jgi:hypothetical protein